MAYFGRRSRGRSPTNVARFPDQPLDVGLEMENRRDGEAVLDRALLDSFSWGLRRAAALEKMVYFSFGLDEKGPRASEMKGDRWELRMRWNPGSGRSMTTKKDYCNILQFPCQLTFVRIKSAFGTVSDFMVTLFGGPASVDGD